MKKSYFKQLRYSNLMKYSMEFFFSLRDTITDKLDNYSEIISVCSNNSNKNTKKRKVFLWQETDPIEKSLNNILNKLSDKNHSIIFDEVERLFKVLSQGSFHNQEKIKTIQKYICYTLLTRAIFDVKYLELYSKLCEYIISFNTDISPVIIKTCEHIFYCELKQSTMPSLYKFYAWLHVNNVLSTGVITYIMNTLYTQEHYIEMCDMITILPKDTFEFHYNLLITLSKDPKLLKRIKFKIMDLLELA